MMLTTEVVSITKFDNHYHVVNSKLVIITTVQLVSKFTARIGKNAYLARFFARHKELHAFDAQVSRLLAQAITLASYAARDLYVLTRFPT